MKKGLTWHPQNLQQSSPVLLWHHQILQCVQESYLHLPSPFPIWPTLHLSEKHLMLFLSKEWPGSSPPLSPAPLLFALTVQGTAYVGWAALS